MRIQRLPRTQAGFGLAMVWVFAAIGVLAVASVISWSTFNAGLNARSNQSARAAAAAEAATEKVLSRMMADFKEGGEPFVHGRLAAYATLVPTPAESPRWQEWVFLDRDGRSNATTVERLTTPVFGPLASEFPGLSAFSADYRIYSSAREAADGLAIAAAVQQDLQLASVPIFQFAAFFNGDMELNGASDMEITGRVHANGNLYTGSKNKQHFRRHVTVAGAILTGERYGQAVGGSVYYHDGATTNTANMSLPLGANPSPAGLR